MIVTNFYAIAKEVHIIIAGLCYGQTQSTPEQCSAKWKALRHKFVKELRKVRSRKSGDEGLPYVSPWRLYKILTFLTYSVKHRQ